MKIVIVGGVAGGASAAARLRRLMEKAEIVLFEKGPYISYANCGLPYYVGGAIATKEDLLLQTPESFFVQTAVDVRVNSEVISIDRQDKTVVIKNHLTGESYTESYDYLLLSPGAYPFVPPMPGADLPGVFTMKDVPDALAVKEWADKTPSGRALVVGGGFIGVEVAENFAEMGMTVTLAELANQIIAPLDFDMAQELHHHMRRRGVDLRLNTGLSGISQSATGLVATFGDGSEHEFDIVVLAIGVRPASRLAKDAGLELDGRGFILTDEHMRTSDPSIFAAGDAVAVRILNTDMVGSIALAGPANRQGRIAADNMAGIKSSFSPAQGSSIIKCFSLTAASTGLNEKTLKNLGMDYARVYINPASHATYYPGASYMNLKLLYAPDTGRVLGAQIVGRDGTDKRCDVLATAIKAGLTVDDLSELELCYAPPYSSAKDPVNMAGFVAQNVRAGLVKPWFWEEAEGLDRTAITLLDVRTAEEFAEGAIEGAVNIPVEELRERLSEIDPKKPVYAYCFSGHRSYTASRLLTGSGFDCRNLMGGWRLYNLVTKA